MRALLPLLCMPMLVCAQESLVWKRLADLPDPLGLAGPIAGVSGDALLVGGGANFPDKMPWEGGKKVWWDRVWVLEKPDGVWKSAGKLPRALGYSVCVTGLDSVFVVGGSDATKHYADAFRLSWREGALQVEPLPPLPIAVSGATGALVGDMLYVACGSESPGEQSATQRAFALNLRQINEGWSELPPLPGKARILAAGGSNEAGFCVIGGCALEANSDGKVGRVYLRDGWRFLEGGGWIPIADLPRPSVAAPSPAPYVEGKILLLAGDDGARAGFQPLDKHPGFPNGILGYDPELDRWSELGKVPAPRATVPCVKWRGQWVVPSGEQRPGVRSPEVWAFQAEAK